MKPLVLSLSLVLLTAPSHALSTEVTRLRLRQTRQWTNNLRDRLGRRLISVATGRSEAHGRTPHSTTDAVEDSTQFLPPAQVVKKPINRAPPVQAVLRTSAEPVAEKAFNAWFDQLAQTRELSIKTSPFTKGAVRIERASSPIVLAGHAKAVYAA